MLNYGAMSDADFEKMQLDMLQKATKEQRAEIATGALLMDDAATCKHLLKHYASEFDASMLAALRHTAEA